MGSEDTEQPEYQMGAGCLVDQLVGQYMAEIAGLGPIVDPANCRKTLESIYRYNYKRDARARDVQRTFVLNDEGALVVALTARAAAGRAVSRTTPRRSTGLEYTAASHMIFAGMVREGVECITSVRARYDGERRNPVGRGRVRLSLRARDGRVVGLLAISGFRYHGRTREVAVLPRLPISGFQCFWSTATGWGTFAFGAAGSPLRIRVLSGRLPCRSIVMPGAGRVPPVSAVRLEDRVVPHTVEHDGANRRVSLSDAVVIAEDQELVVQ